LSYPSIPDNRERTSGNARTLVRGEEEDNRGNDDAKNAEEGVDAAVKRRGVGIGFGRHG